MECVELNLQREEVKTMVEIKKEGGKKMNNVNLNDKPKPCPSDETRIEKNPKPAASEEHRME